ncbi:MAG TPA: tRNA (guanosine(37)-N1)-methyltransferase TrmD [Actinopolymorphaceae bacterium]|jgi:tRNA (guanine37-N1)-methyltransferase
MRVDVVSIFPEYFAPLQLSLVGKAVSSGIVDLRVHDLRDWTHDRHRTVDDTPAGGGPGMVMRPEPWGEALDSIAPPGGPQPWLLVPTPGGTPFTQDWAAQLAREEWLLFACGRYEGIDQRVLEYAAQRMPVSEVSIGDYVLAGGEVAVLVIVEAVVRLLPGVLGNPESLVEESYGSGACAGLVEYPVYTKPATWRGLDVPHVLLSGHHGRIARWRREEALRRTLRNRPDLLERLFAAGGLDERDLEVLTSEGWQPGGTRPT